jgi:ABC-type Fe3+-siderophore transport system permease subunit
VSERREPGIAASSERSPEVEQGGPAAEPPRADRVNLVRWRAVLNGALAGVALLVVVSVIEAILDNNLSDFDDTGWIYPLFVAVLVSYAVGGFVAGRAAPEASLTNGTLAGLGAFVLWIPVRILIWVARDEDHGLFSGHAPVLRPGQVFGHLVIASALGMLGGWLAGRAVARSRAGTGTPRDPSAS